MVHIKDVTNEERGLKCGLVCPACGERLIANLPQKSANYTPRLRHESGRECEGWLEAALRQKAKDVIVSEQGLVFPALTVSVDEHTATVIAAHKYALDNIDVNPDAYVLGKIVQRESESDEDPDVNEHNVFRPDLVGHYAGVPVCIFITIYSHDTDERIRLAKAAQVATLEIDLSELSDPWDEDALTNVVLSEIENKTWLFHPGEQRVHEQLMETIEQEQQRQIASALEQERLQQAAAEMVLAEKTLFDQRKRDFLTYCQDPARMESVKKQWAAKAPEHPLYAELFDRFPYPVEAFFEIDAMAMGCDYRLWQAYVFTQCIRPPDVTPQRIIDAVFVRFQDTIIPELIDLSQDDQADVGRVLDATQSIYTYVLQLWQKGYLAFGEPNTEHLMDQRFTLTDKMLTYLSDNGFLT